MAIEGLFQINQKILTFLNEVNCRRKPKFAKEKIKKKKENKGIIVTIHDNKNITRFISSYNIP